MSKKMDPATCELTDTPQEIDLVLKTVTTMTFKELLPGKIIHIVAAPQVGNQRSQFKAAVTVQWNLQNLGVATYSLATIPGGLLINNATNLVGEYAFTTDRSGEVKFMLAAFNKTGQPLHVEVKSVTIPAIPGIGR